MLGEHVQFFMKSFQIVEIWEVDFFFGGGEGGVDFCKNSHFLEWGGRKVV